MSECLVVVVLCVTETLRALRIYAGHTISVNGGAHLKRCFFSGWQKTIHCVIWYTYLCAFTCDFYMVFIISYASIYFHVAAFSIYHDRVWLVGSGPISWLLPGWSDLRSFVPGVATFDRIPQTMVWKGGFF